MAQASFTLPHPDAVTNNQVDGLLRVVVTMAGALAVSKQSALEITDPILPKEALIAAEVTFINACNRLDGILTDPTRWDLTFQKTLEVRATELADQQKTFFNAQIAAAEEVRLPHFKYRPDIKKLPNNHGWIAYLGDPIKDPVNSILGLGSSPDAALLAFDEVFKGTMPPHMAQWLADREAAIFSQPPPENINETKPLDPGTPRKTRRSAKNRKNS